jgi:hypothetical protein
VTKEWQQESWVVYSMFIPRTFRSLQKQHNINMMEITGKVSLVLSITFTQATDTHGGSDVQPHSPTFSRPWDYTEMRKPRLRP